MANKLTYTKALEMVLEVETVSENKELAEKLLALLESIDKKSGSKSKKEKAKQEENSLIKEIIADTLDQATEKMPIKEMQKVNSDLAEYSNQKLSALIRQMVAEGVLEREEVKRVAMFGIAGKDYQAEQEETETGQEETEQEQEETETEQ